MSPIYQLRIIGIVDTGMNGVERMSYYTHNIPQEQQTLSRSSMPDSRANSEGKVEIPADWPQAGCIVAEKIEMKYKSGPLVLKGLSFTINPGEKVGIVGRTGAKCTLLETCCSSGV